MNHASLKAISPIDGRYHASTEVLQNYFSEHALIRYRVWVEVEYFVALCEWSIGPLGAITEEQIHQLREVYWNIQDADVIRIKELETVTNHDVKAVEYFLREKWQAIGLQDYIEYIHFGLTSQDINNTASPASLRDALETVYEPSIEQLIEALTSMAKEWRDVSLLARTHGQAASPTKLGKEIYVYVERLNEQMQRLSEVPHSAKFGGATGNFNAHAVAFPNIDWVDFANQFVAGKLHLKRSKYTTQIEHYDNLAATFDALKRLNTILIDLCRDVWTYISMNYFTQKTKAGEVGSSAMPHKVNPIDFENAEGNLGIANALFEHLAAKLPVSRLQRDLTDSTVLRNMGVPIAHTMLALKSIEKGLGKLVLNESAIHADLQSNWAVVAEAIQTILRRENFPNPYDALKSLTRGKSAINQADLHAFVNELDVSDAVKEELRNVTPFNYTGVNLLDNELDS
ncbi:MAG: adenylosuccinate lyase [Flavobacteriales bacterium]